MGVDTRLIVQSLMRDYYPFRLLTEDRAREALTAIRTFELVEGEEVTLKGAPGRDYLYILAGRVDIDHDMLDEPLAATAADSLERPLFLPPRPYSATLKAREDSLFLRADAKMFDYLLLFDELCRMGASDPKTHQKIAPLHNALAFRSVPLEALEEVFKRMTWLELGENQKICAEGCRNDAFFILKTGAAASYHEEEDGSLTKVADLSPGDVFGDKAMVVEPIRFSTVRMTTPGSLVRLALSDFDELVKTPLVQEVDAEEAQGMIAQGSRILDIRYEMEREESSIPDSLFIPLHDLKSRTGELADDAPYIVQCRSGTRSRAAAAILAGEGISAVSLKGGIIGWPYDIKGETY